MMQSNAFLREFVPPTDGTSLAFAKPDDTQRKKAYAQGFEDGLAQAQGDIGAQTLDAVNQLLSTLEDLSMFQQSMTSDISDEAGRVLSSVIRTLCPNLAKRGIAERAEHLLGNELRDAPRPLTLNASPDIAEHLETVMTDSLDSEVSVVVVEAMPETRIEVSWPEGGATIDTDDLATRIIALADELDPDLDPVEETAHE